MVYIVYTRVQDQPAGIIISHTCNESPGVQLTTQTQL